MIILIIIAGRNAFADKNTANCILMSIRVFKAQYNYIF